VGGLVDELSRIIMTTIGGEGSAEVQVCKLPVQL
jgi:hypothetical protein